MQAKAIVQLLSELLQEERLRSDLKGAYLIGSLTTGELSPHVGTSDIDILMIVVDSLDDHGCEELKAYLRSKVGERFFGLTGHLGLRCRYSRELGGFARYLALQGYHCNFATSLISPYEDGHLPPFFTKNSSSKDEFLCVLCECLWAEIRALALQGRDSVVVEYAAAKALLAYVNLLLVSHGIFFPTHRERIAAWVAQFRPKDEAALSHALEVKLGHSTSVNGLDFGYLLLRYRADAVERIDHLSNDFTGRFDSAQFWIGKGVALDRKRRLQVTLEISRTMITLLASREGTALSEIETTLTRMEDFSWPPLAELFSATQELPNKSLISRMNSFRVSESSYAKRDWGWFSST